MRAALRAQAGPPRAQVRLGHGGPRGRGGAGAAGVPAGPPGARARLPGRAGRRAGRAAAGGLGLPALLPRGAPRPPAPAARSPRSAGACGGLVDPVCGTKGLRAARAPAGVCACASGPCPCAVPAPQGCAGPCACAVGAGPSLRRAALPAKSGSLHREDGSPRAGGRGAALDGGRLETRSRAQVLGLAPVAFEALVGAVAAGGRSRLLGQIHIALLRLLLADMEEAHASGALQVPRPPSQCRPLAARSTTGAPHPAPHAGAGAARMRAGCGGRPLARGARPAPSAQRLTPRRWRLAACAPGARAGARLPASAARGALRRAASRARRTGTTLWTARWWRARPRWRRPGPGALTWTPGARTSTSCPGPRCAAPARGRLPARPPLPRRFAPHPPASWDAAHGVI